jgi:hypothetical protein
MAQPQARELAHVTDYYSLISAFRARAAEMHIATGSDNVAHVAGIAHGYLGKLLAPRPVRRIGMQSLGPVLGVLGVKIIVVEDEDALRRFGSRLKRRNDNLVRSAASEFRLTHRWLRKIASKGGKSRDAKLTPEQRSELARELNRIRWSKSRVVEIEPSKEMRAATDKRDKWRKRTKNSARARWRQGAGVREHNRRKAIGVPA